MTELKCLSVSSEDDMHIARSKCVDAFAGVEEAVVKLLTRSASKFGTEQLGQKLEILRKAKPGSKYSKAKRTEVLGLLTELEALLPLRADIVHGRLELAQIDGATQAVFVNARNRHLCIQPALLLTLESFGGLSKQVAKISADLNKP